MIIEIAETGKSKQCTAKDPCVPRGHYTKCLKKKKIAKCEKIYKPVCSFNGFEYKVYDNECLRKEDQQCRKDGKLLYQTKFSRNF